MPLAPTLHEDLRLLDALEQAQLRAVLPASDPKDPSAVRARLTALCERHGLTPTPAVIGEAVQAYLATPVQPSLAMSVRPSPAGRSLRPSPWSRPQTVAEWQEALKELAQAMNVERSLDRWRVPLLLGLFLGAMAVVASGSPLASLGLDVVVLSGLGGWLNATRRHRRHLARTERWLRDPLTGEVRLPGSSRRLLARVSHDQAAPEALDRWRLAPANHALLGELSTSPVPLLAGDVLVLEANLAAFTSTSAPPRVG